MDIVVQAKQFKKDGGGEWIYFFDFLIEIAERIEKLEQQVTFINSGAYSDVDNNGIV